MQVSPIHFDLISTQRQHKHTALCSNNNFHWKMRNEKMQTIRNRVRGRWARDAEEKQVKKLTKEKKSSSKSQQESSDRVFFLFLVEFRLSQRICLMHKTRKFHVVRRLSSSRFVFSLNSQHHRRLDKLVNTISFHFLWLHATGELIRPLSRSSLREHTHTQNLHKNRFRFPFVRRCMAPASRESSHVQLHLHTHWPTANKQIFVGDAFSIINWQINGISIYDVFVPHWLCVGPYAYRNR